MIRKAILLVSTLAALLTAVLWISMINSGTFTHFPDMHCIGFAMIQDRFNQSLRFLSYRSYPSVAIPIQLKTIPQYNLLIIPLWSLLVVFWCYPVKVFYHRASRRRYVERRWFAVAAGMSAFAVAAIATMYFVIDASLYRWMERMTGSDDVTLALALAFIVVACAISALATHNVIAGPLRRASLRKQKMCVNCTYNLTGNKSGVCPECGTPVAR